MSKLKLLKQLDEDYTSNNSIAGPIDPIKKLARWGFSNYLFQQRVSEWLPSQDIYEYYLMFKVSLSKKVCSIS